MSNITPCSLMVNYKVVKSDNIKLTKSQHTAQEEPYMIVNDSSTYKYK